MNFSIHWFCPSLACAYSRELEGVKETSNHRLHGLNPIMPHWVFQQLLARADHLFNSHTIFVDFECWNCPHIFGTCNSRALVHINLKWRTKWQVNVVQNGRWGGWLCTSASYLEEINRWISGTQCVHKRGNLAALLIWRCHEMDDWNTCKFQTDPIKKGKNYYYSSTLEHKTSREQVTR